MAWYHTFFNGLPQQAWKAAQSPEQTQLELEFIVETLELGPGDRLLDVFCGYGRHALLLARLGCPVTGVDISEEYIAELQTAARRENLPINAVCADFLTAPLTGPFDAAYCLGNSFSFFPRPTLLRFLRRIADQLPAGGRLLVQSEMVAETILPDYQERSWLAIDTPEGDPITFLMASQYDPFRSRIDQQLTYIRHGQTETRTARHYIYTLAELRRLFERAGFAIAPDDVFGGIDGRPFELGDEAVWLLAHKR